MVTHRIIIVDDHPLFRGALGQALASSLGSTDILEAGSLDELTGLIAADPSVDLILLDLTMPGVQGFSGLLYLRAEYPTIPVMIVSARDDNQTIESAISFGATGFVSKSEPVDRIRQAVKTVLAGDVWVPQSVGSNRGTDRETEALASRIATLTPQQIRVLMMLGEGLLNKQIAYKLGVSEATIKAHVSAILQKLGVDSRTQAVIAVNKIAAPYWQPPQNSPAN